ncbi:unnamed protein product [Urochloa decumbens]|uniref:Uncharacterized protein n=1 Tax=Urochloa decumbens TaxID=240449 RepID=A0ABC8YG85_9POAL
MAGGGAKPSQSTSTIIADTESGHHILRIDGYTRTKVVPTGECLKSVRFTLAGHQWQIHYFPNGDTSESADYISLYLHLDESVVKPVKAQHLVRLVDGLEEQDPSPSLAKEEVFSFMRYVALGKSKFLKRVHLEKSKFLRDDSFAVRCDIVVIKEFRAEGMASEAAPAFISVPASDLHMHFGDLLHSEKGADVVFEVGGQTLMAHRCVLAARSPVFNVELFGKMKESVCAGVICIDDMEAQVFKALLTFIYTDSLPTMTNKEGEEEDGDVMAQHLLVAADRYDIKRLKLICEEKLCKYIEVGTVATILTLADQHHCHGLKKACFSFLSSPANLRPTMATDGFDHLSRSCPGVTKELMAMLCDLVIK